MTIYEQARQEGREQGRQEERITVLARLLALKFGELPSEYAERLKAATAEDLDRYLDRILTADSLAAVFGDPSVNTR